MTIAPLSLFFVRDKWDESFRSGHLILTPLLANLPYDLDYLSNKRVMANNEQLNHPPPKSPYV